MRTLGSSVAHAGAPGRGGADAAAPGQARGERDEPADGPYGAGAAAHPVSWRSRAAQARGSVRHARDAAGQASAGINHCGAFGHLF